MAFDWFDNSTGGGLDTSSSAYQDLQDNAGSDGAFGGGLDSAAVTAANSYGSTWDAITGTVGNTLGSLGNWYGGLSNANKGLLNSALLEGTKGYMQGRAAEKERKARENFQRSMTAVPKLK